MTGSEAHVLERTEGPRLRESNKAEKRRRIRNAAKELFSTQGYEATTLRQIARQAGVGLGTLSLYAEDKRDLVLLIFNEKIQLLNAHARLASEQDGDLIDRLMAMFTVYVEDAGSDLTFARIHHQLSWYSGGRHSKEYYWHRDQLLRMIEKLIGEAKYEGSISSAEDPQFIARQVFFTFSACLRWCIASQQPRIEDCLSDMRRALRFQVTGMNPA